MKTRNEYKTAMGTKLQRVNTMFDYIDVAALRYSSVDYDVGRVTSIDTKGTGRSVELYRFDRTDPQACARAEILTRVADFAEYAGIMHSLCERVGRRECSLEIELRDAKQELSAAKASIKALSRCIKLQDK